MYLWLETTFWIVQKWSLRPFLDSPKGGLYIGILLYVYFEDYINYSFDTTGFKNAASVI